MRRFAWFFLLGLATASASQVDVSGPPGSGNFGVSVNVLPNGNIVVADPTFSSATASFIGVVYLYTPSGTIISSITGSTPDDLIGGGGVTVLKNGNYVVSSPNWHNQAASHAGAVTWCDANGSIAGAVSTTNSLVGSAINDKVGLGGVTALSNGNYVVRSLNWNGGAGAASWGNGNGGTVGAVSASNSLVGTTTTDNVSSLGITALTNGNYVVDSAVWNNGNIAQVGAVTWGDGTVGTHGPVSANNSLVGTTASDRAGYGGVTPLTNGNYVVRTLTWTNANATYAGAVTWGNGSTGTVGAISPANSLVGSVADDAVGRDEVTALTNGNYVVDSSMWHNNTVSNAGAVTWGDGTIGTFGAVSPGNSLVGTSANDGVGYGQGTPSGYGHVTALRNGNYVVASEGWNNAGVASAGAVTWGNGSVGTVGVVSASNSLVGTTYEDNVGSGIIALDNGNYVVSSPFWNNGPATETGAVTWADGTTGITGAVGAANSLIGTTSGDNVGGNTNPPDPPWLNGVAALRNGNYVVSSPRWSTLGAVTWCNGSSGMIGSVSAANSMTGMANDFVGSPVAVALSNGNYVFPSGIWQNSSTSFVGAATWQYGNATNAGSVAASNSLMGTQASDDVASGSGGIYYDGIVALANGNFVVRSPKWNNGTIVAAGAITLGRGTTPLVGAVDATNSVMGAAANAGSGMVYDYDATRDQLVVGRPAENLITLFKIDSLFKNGFEAQ